MGKSLYDDDALFENMHDDAKRYSENNGGDRPTTPLMYFDDGTYTLRVHPDVYTSPEDGKKKLRAVRLIHMHQLSKDMGGRVPCEGENCRICKEVKKLEDAKYGKAWQYKSKEEGIAQLYIYKTSADDSKYVKVKEMTYAVMPPRILIAFQQFIAGLERDEIRMVMNPEQEARALRLNYTGGSKGNAAWGFDLKEYELPELPEDFDDYPIGQVFYDEKNPSESYISDEDLSAFRKFVAKELSGRSVSFNPDDDDRGSRRRSRDDGDDRGRGRDRSDDRNEDRGRSRSRDDDSGERRRNRDDDGGRGDDDRGSRRERSDRDSRDDSRSERSSSRRGESESRDDRGSRSRERSSRDSSDPEPGSSTRRERVRDDDDGKSNRRETREQPIRDARGDKAGSGNEGPDCPGSGDGLAFGKNPEVETGDMHPDCVTCSHEAECQEKTRDNKFDDVPM
jgi:hypothetical protein